MTKSSSNIRLFCDLPTDDPKIRNPDISLAKKHHLLAEETELDKGLQKTIAYFQGIL
jgi:hypothetical protein